MLHPLAISIRAGPDAASAERAGVVVPAAPVVALSNSIPKTKKMGRLTGCWKGLGCFSRGLRLKRRLRFAVARLITCHELGTHLLHEAFMVG